MVASISWGEIVFVSLLGPPITVPAVILSISGLCSSSLEVLPLTLVNIWIFRLQSVQKFLHLVDKFGVGPFILLAERRLVHGVILAALSVSRVLATQGIP